MAFSAALDEDINAKYIFYVKINLFDEIKEND